MLLYMIRGPVCNDTPDPPSPLFLVATVLDVGHTLIFHSSNLISGFPIEGSKYRFFGIFPRSTASTALMRPAMPAAPSRWPTLGLIEPTKMGLSASRLPHNARDTAKHSLGSPAGVPVPWHST